MTEEKKTAEELKGKIIITKEKPTVRNIEDIVKKKDLEDREKKLDDAADDINKFLQKLSERRKKSKDAKPNKLKTFLIFLAVAIIIFLLVNLLLFNIWAFKTLLQEIIGWFR